MYLPQEFDDVHKRQKEIEAKMMDFEQASMKLSDMSHDDIVKSWLYYRNSYYRLTMQ